MATGAFFIVKVNENVGSVGVNRTKKFVFVVIVQVGLLLIPDTAVQL